MCGATAWPPSHRKLSIRVEKHHALVMPGGFFEESQVKGVDTNEVWRTQIHKGISPQQFSFLEFCFPSFLVDGFVTPPLLPLRPAGQRLVCWVFARAMFFVVDQGQTWSRT